MQCIDNVSKHILEAEQRLWMKRDGDRLAHAHALLNLCNFACVGLKFSQLFPLEGVHVTHTSSACKLHPGAAGQGKASQRSAEQGGSSEGSVNLPRDAKEATVWSEQFWLNIFSFLRQLQCCFQRRFGHNFDRFPVANLHQLRYFLAPVFERLSK